MAQVETYGGTFSTDAPGKYEVRGDNMGASIRLHFTPNELVEAPKIGLIQTANSVKDGNPVALRPEIEERSNTAEEGDEGRHIDRMGGRTNPMYGANNPPGGSTDLGASATAGNAHFGHRTRQPDGTHDTDDAWLTDAPRLGWSAGETGRQTFETTALCLEGDMAGTYLGSVTWGYDRQADGSIDLRTLEVASMGVPSGQFMTSAEKWNDADIEMGADPDAASQDLPLTEHRTVDPSGLSDRDLERRMRELHERLRSMNQADDPNTYRNMRFEIRGLGREAVNRGDRVEDSGSVLDIAAGDSLWALAAEHLGSGALWVQIFALNAASLRHGDRIMAGGKLKMPKPYSA